MTNTQYEPDYIVRNNPSQSQSKSPPWALRSNPLHGWPFGHLCLVLMLHSCGKLSLSEGQRLRLQLLAKNLNLPNYILKYYWSAPENSPAGKVRQIFFPIWIFFLPFFHPPGLEIAFKLFCQLRKRGVAGSPVRIPLRFRSAVVTCVQFAAKASGNWTQIIIAYFCMRCRFTARRITVIKVEQGEIIRLRQGLRPESMSGRNQL